MQKARTTLSEDTDKSIFNKELFANHIVIRRGFSGKLLNPEEFHEFQKIVNIRRPYCSSDFKKQHFFPDLYPME